MSTIRVRTLDCSATVLLILFSRTNFLFISKINNPFTQRQAVWIEPEFPG